MTNANLIGQAIDSMRIDERPKAFPQMGGAYDSRSLLIYTKVQGNKTYKDRLDRFVTDLSKELTKSAKQAGSELKVKRIDLEKALLCLVHSFADNDWLLALVDSFKVGFIGSVITQILSFRPIWEDRLSKKDVVYYCKTLSIRSTKFSLVYCRGSSVAAPRHCFNLKDRPIAMSSPL